MTFELVGEEVVAPYDLPACFLAALTLHGEAIPPHIGRIIESDLLTGLYPPKGDYLGPPHDHAIRLA